MTPVLRLPGVNCLHYRLGRCLYEETLNPGYDQALRCQVLTRLQEAYDQFITQADAFGLAENTAAAIWAKRCQSFQAQETGCQDHKPNDTKDFPGCDHAAGDVCLLALPVCTGQCANFSAVRGAAGAQGSMLRR